MNLKHPRFRSPRPPYLRATLIFLILMGLGVMTACPSLVYKKLESTPGPLDRSDLPLRVKKIRGSVYLAEDFNYWKTNTVFYAAPDGIMFFDAGWTAKTARRIIFKAAVASEGDYIGVVATSFQLQHTGGLRAFSDENIKIFMHEKTRPLMLDAWNHMHKEMQATFSSWRQDDPGEPDGLFDSELKILGGRIIVYYPGAAHTPDNVVVYFPDEKLLYAGSLLSDPLLFTGNADPHAYLQALDSLKRFDFDLIVSGHGEALRQPDLIQLTRERVLKMRVTTR